MQSEITLLIEDAKKNIKSNRLHDAIDGLLRVGLREKIESELIVIHNRLEDLNSKTTKGIISGDEESIQRAKIVDDLLSVCNKIERPGFDSKNTVSKNKKYHLLLFIFLIVLIPLGVSFLSSRISLANEIDDAKKYQKETELDDENASLEKDISRPLPKSANDEKLHEKKKKDNSGDKKNNLEKATNIKPVLQSSKKIETISVATKEKLKEASYGLDSSFNDEQKDDLIKPIDKKPLEKVSFGYETTPKGISIKTSKEAQSTFILLLNEKLQLKVTRMGDQIELSILEDEKNTNSKEAIKLIKLFIEENKGIASSGLIHQGVSKSNNGRYAIGRIVMKNYERYKYFVSIKENEKGERILEEFRVEPED